LPVDRRALRRAEAVDLAPVGGYRPTRDSSRTTGRPFRTTGGVRFATGPVRGGCDAAQSGNIGAIPGRCDPVGAHLGEVGVGEHDTTSFHVCRAARFKSSVRLI
jgi:hypothetical protein